MPEWLVKVGHFFQKVGTWLKGNWLLLVLGVGLVFGVIFLKRRTDGYDNLLKQFRDQQAANQKAMDDLRKVQQEQIAAQQEIDKKYREVMDRIEKNYRDQLHALDAQKEKELKQVIAENRDDPNAMAEEINSLFGLPIYTIPSQRQ